MVWLEVLRMTMVSARSALLEPLVPPRRVKTVSIWRPAMEYCWVRASFWESENGLVSETKMPSRVMFVASTRYSLVSVERRK